MLPELAIPSPIEAVIQEFDCSNGSFTEDDVEQALGKAQHSLQNPTEAENFGAWAERLAFALVDTRMQASPWGSYFGPIGSRTNKEGKTVYFPDIGNANAAVIAHWSDRAKAVSHPVLKARYADLAWDLCAIIAKARRDPEMARLAIDAYMASVPSTIRAERHDQFIAALRALDLAIMIHDVDRIELARAVLLRLHREVMEGRKGQWWFTYDRLIEEKNGGVTEAERKQLANDLEELVRYYGDTSVSDQFDPHALQDAARRLIRYYTQLGRPGDGRRLHEAIARAFEHFAGLGNALLASTVLQTAVNAYRDAGLHEESKRVRILMEIKIGESRAEMGSFESEFKISHDDMEAFLKAVVVDEIPLTLFQIAAQFLPNRRELEKEVGALLERSPLLALLPSKIIEDHHVAAEVGSVEDDPFGRLIQQTAAHFGFEAVWLQAALERAIRANGLSAEHLVGWTNRFGLFDDVTLLIEGVRAWLESDLVKAVHVLVPQVERGLRAIVSSLEKPVTKPHGKVANVGVAIGIGDILYIEEIAQVLGPDLTLYFLSLYADPRGINLRNRVAHGLIKPESVNGNLTRLLIHTLLVFGAWKELAEMHK